MSRNGGEKMTDTICRATTQLGLLWNGNGSLHKREKFRDVPAKYFIPNFGPKKKWGNFFALWKKYNLKMIFIFSKQNKNITPSESKWGHLRSQALILFAYLQNRSSFCWSDSFSCQQGSMRISLTRKTNSTKQIQERSELTELIRHCI